MNLKHMACLVATLVSLLPLASAQNFINLNFEQAQIVYNTNTGGGVPGWPPGNRYIYASNAVPGWTASGAFGQINDFVYDGFVIGADGVSLFLSNSIHGYPFRSLDGDYSIALNGNAVFRRGTSSISQTGLVPASAMSLQFIATNIPPVLGSSSTMLFVSLGGQNIPFYPIGNVPNYTLYGGDISAFGGQVEPLTFSSSPGNGYWEIDDIQFSPSPIPEPNVSGLLVLGSLLFSLRHLFRRVGRSYSQAGFPGRYAWRAAPSTGQTGRARCLP
jgi:hypothetical protein